MGLNCPKEVLTQISFFFENTPLRDHCAPPPPQDPLAPDGPWRHHQPQAVQPKSEVATLPVHTSVHPWQEARCSRLLFPPRRQPGRALTT